MFVDNNEFQQWCDKLGLSPAAIELIIRIRSSDPSRNVGGGRGNVSGAYPSRKMGVTIHFESHTVELPGIIEKEYNDKVIEMYDQPLQIQLIYQSKNGRTVSPYYTPDFFVIFDDCAGWEEYKTEEELSKLSENSPNRYKKIDGVWRCPPGEEYAKQFGLRFWVRSSASINYTYIENLKYLEDYRKEAVIPHKVANEIKNYVHDNPGITLHELKTAGRKIDYINYLIASYEIYVDLETELLTNQKNVHVFRDKQSSVSYQVISRNYKPSQFYQPLELKVGTFITWNGIIWKIANIAKDDVSILSNENSILTIKKGQFYEMADHDEIISIRDPEEARSNAIKSYIFESSDEDKEEANRRFQIIKPILDGLVKNDGHIQGITIRTIRTWVSRYRKAEQLNGNGLNGLTPQLSNKGNRGTHLPQEIYNEIYSYLVENDAPVNQMSGKLYGTFEKLWQLNHPDLKVPSLKCFRRINKRRTNYTKVQKTLGSRAAYQIMNPYWTLDKTTPRHGSRPFEVVHIDHTELDIQLVDSEELRPLGRPWLTLMVDAFSRRILAFYVTFDSPSHRSDMMVIRECVLNHEMLPYSIITDHGADFKSTYFQTLLANYQITHKMRPVHYSRHGSVIERLFGITNTELIHELDGNTKITRNNMRQVTESVNPKNNAIWTLPALSECLKEYFFELYDTKDHSTLLQSPREAFVNGMEKYGERPSRRQEYTELFHIMTLPSVRYNNGALKLNPRKGITYRNHNYYTPIFYEAQPQFVKVRYDPWDDSYVYCFFDGEWIKVFSSIAADMQNKSAFERRIITEENKILSRNISRRYPERLENNAKLVDKRNEKQHLRYKESQSILATISNAEKVQLDFSSVYEDPNNITVITIERDFDENNI